MNCEQYQQQVSRMFDGLLEPSAQPALFDHLSKCNDCRRFFSSVNQIRIGFRSLAPITVPKRVDDRILAKLWESGGSFAYEDRPAIRQSPWHRTVPIPIPTLLLFLAMLIFGGLIFTVSSRSESNAEEMLLRQTVQSQYMPAK